MSDMSKQESVDYHQNETLDYCLCKWHIHSTSMTENVKYKVLR